MMKVNPPLGNMNMNMNMTMKMKMNGRPSKKPWWSCHRSTTVLSIVLSMVYFLSLSSMYALHHSMMIGPTSLELKSDDRSSGMKNVQVSPTSHQEETTKNRPILNTHNNINNKPIGGGMHLDNTNLSLQRFDGSNRLQEETKKRDKKERTKTLERLLKIGLFNASTYMDLYTLNELPPWTQIEDMYGGGSGSGPTILGLETCNEYQSHVPRERDRWVAPTGLFHTGTNLISNLLGESCLGMNPHFQVPWGKHNPISARQESYRVGKEMYQNAKISHVLPIVMIRHPIDWMSSMCHHSYAASYNHSMPCPGLGETKIQAKLYKNFSYPDFLHFWMDWYRPYLLGNEKNNDDDNTIKSTKFPRLVIRLEDLVYYPKETINQICKCTGGYSLWELNGTPPSQLRNRQGGDRRKLKRGTLQVVEAWKRHGNVSLQSLSPNDQTAVMSSPILAEIKPLLDAVNYKL